MSSGHAKATSAASTSERQQRQSAQTIKRHKNQAGLLIAARPVSVSYDGLARQHDTGQSPVPVPAAADAVMAVGDDQSDAACAIAVRTSSTGDSFLPFLIFFSSAATCGLSFSNRCVWLARSRSGASRWKRRRRFQPPDDGGGLGRTEQKRQIVMGGAIILGHRLFLPDVLVFFHADLAPFTPGANARFPSKLHAAIANPFASSATIAMCPIYLSYFCDILPPPRAILSCRQLRSPAGG